LPPNGCAAATWSSGTYDHIDGTGQIQAVPASGRIGELLKVYDEFGDAQLEVTVGQLRFSTQDPLGQPKHGLYMGAYVRLDAVVDQPDELGIAALVATTRAMRSLARRRLLRP
jgi:hypothetical protein